VIVTNNETEFDQVVTAAISGNPSALSILMMRSWAMAFRLGTRLLGDRAAAQDIAQTACERVLRSLFTLRSVRAYDVWFYSIVARLALRERASTVRSVSAERCDQVFEFDSTESIVINDAIDQLPPELREVVIMFYGCDLRTADIARSLKIPHGTVRYRLHEARRRLREILRVDTDKERVGAQ
jgi:RNA polymerase sigma-70 factor, ECF subfamily